MSILDAIREGLRPYYLRCVYFPFRPTARPPSFSDCWRLPSSSLDDAANFLAGFAGAGEAGVVFFPMNDWHTRIQRSQQLARTLASSGRPIFYANPHLGRQFRTLRLFSNQHMISRVEENICELQIRLPREPVFHERQLRSSESRIVADAVRTAIESVRVKRAIQIVSLPIWMDAALLLREETGSPIVYDCHDHLAGLPKMAPAIVSAEERAVREADLVLFSSNALKDRYSGVRSGHSILLRNAADAPTVPPRQAREESPSKRPVAGYIGALGSWFDDEAVQRAAESHPEIDFVLAGTVESERVRRLGSLPNVSLLGEVPYAEVGALCASFDVGLIPFRINELTRATNPIKFYEYCAYGLPIVSTRLPEVEAFGDAVHLASGPEEFAAQVGHAIEEQGDTRRRRRLEIAKSETWSARGQTLSAEFAKLLSIP